MPSVLEVAVANAGIRKGMRGAQYLLEWAVVAADGVEFTGSVTAQVRAYRDWWDESDRSAWRHLAEFKQAFPGEETPARLAAELAPLFVDVVAKGRELQRSRRRTRLIPAVAGAFNVPVPA